jgi:RNA polymerase sigma-70 factor (ECF subfamily)
MGDLKKKADFAQAFQALKEMIWKLSSRFAPIKEDREDLFQEIFLSIHKALPGFRGEAALTTWGYRIAVNTAMGWQKKQRRSRLLKNLLLGFRVFEEDKSMEGQSESAADLEKALEKLSPRQRMILVLADVEEKKLSEVAEIMKLPIGTVKSNLSRARELVKKEIEKGEGK